jgi:hypothetical protein
MVRDLDLSKRSNEASLIPHPCPGGGFVHIMPATDFEARSIVAFRED